MLPTLLPALTCLGARRFCSKRRPFGSLPVKMKFFRVSNIAKLQNSFKCPLTAYECETDVFFNQYFHLRKKITWESYSYSLSYSRDFLIVKLNFSLFLTKPICARPPKPAYMPAFGLKIDRPPSRHLQPALRIGSTCKGFHYSLLLITPFYSLIERTRTRLIADFDVGLRSN